MQPSHLRRGTLPNCFKSHSGSVNHQVLDLSFSAVANPENGLHRWCRTALVGNKTTWLAALRTQFIATTQNFKDSLPHLNDQSLTSWGRHYVAGADLLRTLTAESRCGPSTPAISNKRLKSQALAPSRWPRMTVSFETAAFICIFCSRCLIYNGGPSYPRSP